MDEIKSSTAEQGKAGKGKITLVNAMAKHLK
jgi:hypothetical protein